MNRSTSVIVSASECAASDSMAEEWLIRPPTSLAIAIPRFAAPATITVPVLSPPEPCSGLPTSPCVDGTGGPGVEADCAAVTRGGWLMAAAAPRRDAAQPRGAPAVLQPAAPPTGSADADEVDDEPQRRAGLDDAAGPPVPVGLVRGDGQPGATADPHARDALVPALDHHA